MKKRNLEIFDNSDRIAEEIINLSDEAVLRIGASMPWQYGGVANSSQSTTDADGFSVTGGSSKDEIEVNRESYQLACWNAFWKNPQVNTSLRGIAGRLSGFGFSITSDIFEIQEFITKLIYDPRNRLFHFLPVYVTRSFIEGELFLLLTVHRDGFIEIDFIDPSNITGGENGDGIITHPTKTSMPLVYLTDDDNNKGQYPSIYLARYPELLKSIKDNTDLDEDLLNKNKGTSAVYKKLGGFNRFVVSWDKGLMTRRSTAHLRTTLQWLNYYEDLKKYEIDHKKSAGSYLWLVEFDDMRSYKIWLSLSDEEKRKTGIMATKTPGSTLILPPGMKFKASNPTLPNISDADTDILHQITSGLNEPEDVSTGQAKGTFASVKASRGPMSDRTSDEAEYFERFLKHDLFSAIFFLTSSVSKFPSTFKIREAVSFKNKKPIFKEVERLPEFLIDVTFPTSEIVEYESRAKALLGVKHGSTHDTLGMPHSVIAKKIGFSNYKRLRLIAATEDEIYPELIPTEDQESVEEKKLEPAKKPKRREL